MDSMYAAIERDENRLLNEHLSEQDRRMDESDAEFDLTNEHEEII